MPLSDSAIEERGLLTGVRTTAYRLGLDAQVRAALGILTTAGGPPWAARMDEVSIEIEVPMGAAASRGIVVRKVGADSNGSGAMKIVAVGQTSRGYRWRGCLSGLGARGLYHWRGTACERGTLRLSQASIDAQRLWKVLCRFVALRTQSSWRTASSTSASDKPSACT